jgi:hypothetical protein
MVGKQLRCIQGEPVDPQRRRRTKYSQLLLGKEVCWHPTQLEILTLLSIHLSKARAVRSDMLNPSRLRHRAALANLLPMVTTLSRQFRRLPDDRGRFYPQSEQLFKDSNAVVYRHHTRYHFPLLRPGDQYPHASTMTTTTLSYALHRILFANQAGIGM